MRASDFARRRARLMQRFDNRKRQRKVMRALVRESGARLVVAAGHVIAWRMPDGQAVCVKQRFRSEAAAVAMIPGFAATIMDGGKTPQRAYECRLCGGWHLTSWRNPPAFVAGMNSSA